MWFDGSKTNGSAVCSVRCMGLNTITRSDADDAKMHSLHDTVVTLSSGLQLNAALGVRYCSGHTDLVITTCCQLQAVWGEAAHSH